ncbi:MAG: hypothetical protein KAI50_04405 [Desulfobacterales bacterium]|nr:hypothetical protein [Desulfobacterales bacterium]
MGYYRDSLQYIEQLGTGIMRIKEECKKMALPEPKFEETSNFFKATIFRTQLILSPIIRCK